MGKYSIDIKASIKTIEIVTEGFFSAEEGKNYIQDYNSTLKKINPSQYSLVVDASKQSVVSQDVKVILTDALKLYSSSGFKTVTVKTGNNAVLKMQCSNIVSSNKFNITVL